MNTKTHIYERRIPSLIIVLLMYVVAFALGSVFIIYLKQDFVGNEILLLLIADIIATLIIFIGNLVVKNASVYDAYWSVQTIWLVIMLYVIYPNKFNYWHLAILIPVMLWTFRLTINWIIGFENLKWEDWRYRMYKEKFGKFLGEVVMLTGIMLFPTLIVFAGSLPLFFIILNPHNVVIDFNQVLPVILLVIGGIISAAGCILEAIADRQMRNYKKSKKRSPIIDEGLWKYSRHPNYLGEITVWIGIFIAGIAVWNTADSMMWITVASPVLILLLFLFISIPMAEKRQSRKIEYLEYQKTTSMLLLLPKRKRD